MTDSLLPKAKLRIIDPDNGLEEMQAFARRLAERGERPWFEVRWPSPNFSSPEEREQWQIDQEAVYDAVELIDGEIVTLPPYAVLLGEAEAI